MHNIVTEVCDHERTHTHTHPTSTGGEQGPSVHRHAHANTCTHIRIQHPQTENKDLQSTDTHMQTHAYTYAFFNIHRRRTRTFNPQLCGLRSKKTKCTKQTSGASVWHLLSSLHTHRAAAHHTYIHTHMCVCMVTLYVCSRMCGAHHSAQSREIHPQSGCAPYIHCPVTVLTTVCVSLSCHYCVCVSLSCHYCVYVCVFVSLFCHYCWLGADCVPVLAAAVLICRVTVLAAAVLFCRVTVIAAAVLICRVTVLAAAVLFCRTTAVGACWDLLPYKGLGLRS